MIDYILKFYGINCNNKWIGYFATGLTLSALSTVILILIFFKISDNIIIAILVKLMILISISSTLFNYFMIKYKSTELFELSRKLKKFQNKSSISQLDLNLFSIFSIILSFYLAFISTMNYFCGTTFTDVFEELNGKIETLPISSFLQIFILKFYHFSLFICVQLLYIDYKTRYISFIREFRKEVLNEKSETDSDVLKLTQKFVLKFVNFKNDIKGNVDFLKYGISLSFFSTIIINIIPNFLMPKPECNHFAILTIVPVIGYYLWTMSLNLRIRITENNLSLILSQWLHLKPEDMIYIDMDYIEKKNVKSFKEKEAKSQMNDT
jgi:hypothetical protein